MGPEEGGSRRRSVHRKPWVTRGSLGRTRGRVLASRRTQGTVPPSLAHSGTRHGATIVNRVAVRTHLTRLGRKCIRSGVWLANVHVEGSEWRRLPSLYGGSRGDCRFVTWQCFSHVNPGSLERHSWLILCNAYVYFCIRC